VSKQMRWRSVVGSAVVALGQHDKHYRYERAFSGAATIDQALAELYYRWNRSALFLWFGKPAAVSPACPCTP